MIRKIKTLKDVVDWDLCTGCGACYYACDNRGVKLVNIEGVGIRPHFESEACAACTDCLSICPGYSVDVMAKAQAAAAAADWTDECGSALEIWEGNATDQEIRYRASSGGVLSALATYSLEQENMAFILHTGVDSEKPWLNKTVQSRSRSEILSRTGSRYAPASPCDGLGAIESSDRPCVFIGKPCDTTAVSKLRQHRPELDKKLGLVLSFFCAGTPSTKGTLNLIKELDVPIDSIGGVRYRGEGWPGRFKVTYDQNSKQKSMSYDESWGKLSHYRPLRCHLCPDGVGRVADISCGDAWENYTADGNAGRSIVIVRTERGREILHRAIAAKYVELTPATKETIVAAQPNLLDKRRQLFGRLAGLRLFLIPVPQFHGFSLLQAWLTLPVTQKMRSIAGTMKRVVVRNLWQRRRIFVN